MAKKDAQSAQPVISQIPMPISDSPLVIDLPDGQKLVVGKMSAGTVIEVATWRGTGRPDSRTSRLMLGMSSAESVAEQAKAEKEVAASAKKKFSLKAPSIKSLGKIDFSQILKFVTALSKKVLALPKQMLDRVKFGPKAEGNKRPAKSVLTNDNFEESEDIKAWLDKMTEGVKAKSAVKEVLSEMAIDTPSKKSSPKKAAKKAPVKSKSRKG